MKKGILKDTAWGISPLGGNSVEGTVPGCAPIRDVDASGNPLVEEVPLEYDHRVGNFISEQGVDDLDDKDITIARSKDWNRDAEWRAKAGIKKSITPNQVHTLVDQ